MQPHLKLSRPLGQQWLFGLSLFALCWMTLLLYAGGITTSIEAGMAFLDWPLSNGSLNPEGWTRAQDQLAEHSHRLLGMKVGFVSLVLLALSHVFKARRAIKRIALLLVVVILFQGLLGGLRVLFDPLNTQAQSNTVTEVFLVLHACGAQITLCVLVTLVLATSPSWSAAQLEVPSKDQQLLKNWTRWAVAVLFLQLVLGALVRHLKAATVFGSHFPLLTGEWLGWESILPPVATLPVLAHYLHRVGAVVVTVLLILLMQTIWKSSHWRRPLGVWAGALAVLLMLQITLGALVVWTLRNPHTATFHTLNGAFMLAITWGMLWYAHRKSVKEPQP